MLSIKSRSKSMKQLVMLFECVNKNDTKFPSGGTGRRHKHFVSSHGMVFKRFIRSGKEYKSHEDSETGN